MYSKIAVIQHTLSTRVTSKNKNFNLLRLIFGRKTLRCWLHRVILNMHLIIAAADDFN